ncbi:MAG: acetate--CoA ligase family protein [Bacteroidales bacterium]|nr:acetate--CoA ligase family protein [Bacteroidales bacterium]
MINQQLVNPRSIVIVGGSEDLSKPGGKLLKNILDGGYEGDLYVSNPKADKIQGIRSYKNPDDLPETDLAILAIAAKYCPGTIEYLAKNKNTRAFIVLSAGFSEENEEGAILEKQMVGAVNQVNGCLIGPNCVGFLNQNYNGVFTTPIPKLDPAGCDFISGSGATAVFIMEAGIPNGLTFSSVYSVGNSAQLGVEDVLKYMDESFDPETTPRVKLLYIESINKPQMLLKHASSLIRKGCKIAAIKAGSSDAGSRAASSHTGALAGSDTAADALFRKAGIVRCHSREELTVVASVFMHKKLHGKNIAVITHAGGPAVMLTDTLSDGEMSVPEIKGGKADDLLNKLHAGSSVANPIDFLATGNAEQLGLIIDAVENDFNHIDGMVVIFGSPGLLPVYDVYEVLHRKMETCKKPIFPVLPSIINVKDEIKFFLSKGRINFPDEVALGRALSKVYFIPEPVAEAENFPAMEQKRIREIINNAENGYLVPEKVQQLLDAAGIPRVQEEVVTTEVEAEKVSERLGYPLVMKVVGPLHKSDVGGVALNVKGDEEIRRTFKLMMKIKGAKAVLLQPMLAGIELFVGAKKEDKFGHLVMCGLGGIFIEVLKDVQSGLAPLCFEEAKKMVRNLKGYGIIKGARKQKGVDEKKFIELIIRVAKLVDIAPEISEMDLNPVLGTPKKIVAIDARICVKK